MKENIVRYLNCIGMSEAVVNRVSCIYNEITQLFATKEIEAALICDVNNNGLREFTSLWFFTSSMAYECKRFMVSDDYDVTPIEKNVVYFNIIKDKYSFDKDPEDNSQVTMNALSINGKITMNFHVTGENCKYAIEIARNFLIPNVVS